MSKHIPFRTCLICRTKKEKSQLIRISLDPDGNIVVGMAPKETRDKVLNTGRGVYVCRKEQCINKITKSVGKSRRKQAYALSRSFRQMISVENMDQLEKTLSGFMTKSAI